VHAARHSFADDVFAEDSKGKVNVGTFLRLSMIEAFGRLADRLRGCEAVVGFEVRNDCLGFNDQCAYTSVRISQ
jgi:hypothetical protein